MCFASRLTSLCLLSALGLLLPRTAQAQFTARIQAIHNAPDPAVAVVDIYANGFPLLDDVAFRTATAYLEVPALIPLEIGVAPSTSTSAADVFFTFSVTLLPDQTVQFIAVGVQEPGDFAPNPDGISTALDVLVNEDAREAASDPSVVQVNVVHGSPDAPTVDVVARDIDTLVNDATYTDLTGYISMPATDYTLDIATADGASVMASFSAPLTGTEGQALTVLASGFLDPSQNQNGEAFGLLAAFADGTTLLLPIATSAEEREEPLDALAEPAVSPNPSASAARIVFDLAEQADVTVEVFDALGRRVLTSEPHALAAGANRQVALDVGRLPVGVYVYRLTAQTPTGAVQQSGRLSVVR